MKKKSKKSVDKDCRSIDVGVGVNIKVCRDYITNGKDIFIAIQDSRGSFVGSMMSKADAKKIINLINAYLKP